MKKKTLVLKLFALFTAVSLCYSGNLALLQLASFGSRPAIAEVLESETGTLKYSDGAIYEGELKNGQIRNGAGKYTWKTGESYVGAWTDDRLTGEGVLTLPGLGTYVGEFANGKREGNGTFTWVYDNDPADGNPVSFEGTWHNDKIGSKGKLVIAGIGTYNGSFAKQVRSGKGIFTWENGDVYDGVWANDAITGEGVLTLADGTILSGNFANGVLKKGTVSYAVEGGTAVRDVVNGKMGASVEITYKDMTIITGKLNNGEFTGAVTIHYGNGDTYVGALSQGLKNGKGTYSWKSGAHYVGSWVADKMSGNGKYYYSADETKNRLTGNFTNGYPNGTLILVSDNKLKYETVWSNGKCTRIKYVK